MLWGLGLLVAPLGAQQTFYVGGFGGLGSIPAAIALAQPGDTVVAGQRPQCGGRVSLQDLGMNGAWGWRIFASDVTQLHLGRVVAGVVLLDPSVSIASATTGSAAYVTVELSTLTTRIDGSILTVDNQGRAGDAFVTVLGLPGPELPTPLGATWLDPASLSILAFGAFGPTRRQVGSIDLSTLPFVPQGLTVAVQNVVFGANGQLGLGSFSLVTNP